MSVTFSYGGLSIGLRNPELDNADKMNWDRVQRENRGGDLNIFRDPEWPKFHQHSLEFRLLKAVDKEVLLSFVKQTLGQIITYVDYEGRTWTGIITNPVLNFSQEFRGDSDNYKVAIEFESVVSP
jgi:hypothetical protein